MDLQDVANLTIPEGGVKTIHDKDNRLLWGAVGYDTKYAGNTTQNGEPTPDAPVTVNVVTGAQNVLVHGKNLCKAVSVTNNNRNLNFYIVRPSLDTITLSATVNVTLTGNSIYLSIDGTNYGAIGTMSGTAGQLQEKTLTFTESQMQAMKNATTIGLSIYRSSGGFVASTDGQIEIGSTNTQYEPYQSQSFTIDLGSTELCKIGTYQDYIYKSGDDWYVHKEAKKVIFDGSEDENWATATSSGVRFFRIDTSDGAENSEQLVKTISDRFIGRFESVSNSIALSGSVAGRILIFINNIASSVAIWKTWLASNNVTVYYALATPTNTKITDSTLISQLDAIHQFLTRYGYSSTVSGNLPLIISKTNL